MAVEGSPFVNGLFVDFPRNDCLNSFLLNIRYAASTEADRTVDDFACPSSSATDQPCDDEASSRVDDANGAVSISTKGKQLPVTEKRARRKISIDSDCLVPSVFLRSTKKVRQQVITSILSVLRNQLVVFNVKSLFRAYLIYHREDRLIHALCDVFGKRKIYSLGVLRAEIITKNTKPFVRKAMRDKQCNEVMSSNPYILRLFDSRLKTYCRTYLSGVERAFSVASNSLPVIMCLNESDVDVMFERCRSSINSKEDFPLDLLPLCVRAHFAKLLGRNDKCDVDGE